MAIADVSTRPIYGGTPHYVDPVTVRSPGRISGSAPMAEGLEEGESLPSNHLLLRRTKLDQERRGNLPRSVEKRMIALRAFTRWLGDKSLLEVEREDIERFLDQRHIGNNTRYTWISHFHCFYEWARSEGITHDDPTARIVRPRIRRRLPRPAATDQLAEALKIADPELRCWLVLAAYQGLRVQEIAGLDRGDVIEAEGLLRVTQGKGDKERMLPLHPEVLAALNELPMPRTGWVFRRQMGGKYTAPAMSLAFNQALRDHGVEATAHQLRHWFATNLYGATHDLRLTQEMLGHASPQTTAIYTQFDAKAARKAVTSLDLDGDAA